jgi:hypothetical protein
MYIAKFDAKNIKNGDFVHIFTQVDLIRNKARISLSRETQVGKSHRMSHAGDAHHIERFSHIHTDKI